MANHRWGFHHGTLSCRDLVLENDITIKGDMSFGDASADTLSVTGEATFSAASTFNSTISAKDSLTFASTGTLANAISFTGTVTNVLDFDADDGSSGANVSASCGTMASDAAIKIDIDGTAYFIPAYTATNTTNSW